MSQWSLWASACDDDGPIGLFVPFAPTDNSFSNKRRSYCASIVIQAVSKHSGRSIPTS